MLDISLSVNRLLKKDSTLQDLFYDPLIENLYPESNYFQSIVRSIVYQQLSGKVAKKIHERFINVFNLGIYPYPKDVLNISKEKLRAVGLSYMKVDYIKNVAAYFIDNPKVILTLNKKSDQEIISLITSIKGVGVWTAQMFLIFTLNRPDVFPVTDLALQKGYSTYFKKKKLVNPKKMLDHSKKWIPHRTTMSLYLWRYLEGPFEW
ncbi:MAG: hypothetical protein CBE24_06760 [bacterium TMED264]|nr:MAG: hypothetical protein CBE24_06760 [bacterium TMED264]